MKKVLLIEDEQNIVKLLQAYLEKADFIVASNAGDKEVMQVFRSFKPDMVLLDLMLVTEDGWSLLQKLRLESGCPIIIITARGAITDRLEGLDLGADDYIAKPFDPNEVVARVKAVLRRSVYLADADHIRLGSLQIDTTKQQLTIAQQEVALIPRDFQLIGFMAQYPNQCFSRAQLLDQVWGIDFVGGERAVDAAIKRIRKALQLWPKQQGEIMTMKGIGYCLRVYETEQ
ncbi:response regulator transcription factor [Paenibacillus yanchengensis]|uniref:Response regulator transcription factor n=1 Tax=Paenibacillus yanchengensis TaxID=2035833 RepID=A0ABW4YII5_9BACL